jgi:hypothetical protein
MEAYLVDFKQYPTDHDPDDFSQKGLYQLTSPLKYLGAIPDEPFARAGGLLDPNSDEVGWEMGSTGLGKWPVKRQPKINAFSLASYGPDVRDDHSCGDDWPLCEPPPVDPCNGSGIAWTDYSPTNGTKSIGDLMQTGGETRTGNYCLNGWQIIRGYYPSPPF